VQRHPGRYVLIGYEDLAREPEPMTRMICATIGEPYTPEMLRMRGGDDHAERGNSSFDDVATDAISTKAIGRYRQVLTPSEIAFIELVAGRDMTAVGYARAGSGLRGTARLRFLLWDLPFQYARMLGWIRTSRSQQRRGVAVPEGRIGELADDEATDGPDDEPEDERDDE
jgi:hypothetical protein